MSKKFNLGIIALLAFGIALGTCNIASADNGKIAVVDVQKIVSESKQVKALKDEQVKKAEELNKWIERARADVNKQTTSEAKEKLLKKYDDEFAKKREANANDYAKKLTAIDNSISATIAAEAKARGFDVVIAKSTVLYGGVDITAEVAKAVK